MILYMSSMGILMGLYCTLTSPLIGQQFVTLLAAALEAAHSVPTHVVTPPVVETALVNVCGQKNIRYSRSV